MKNHPLFVIFLLTIVCNIQAQISLFDNTIIHEIKISSTDSNLWQNLTDDYNNGIASDNIPYRSVTIEIDGFIMSSVGIRQKGVSSNTTVSTTKKPLKLNFGKFVDGQKYDGVKKINLGNGVGDPAIIKDKLAYNMLRYHGIPSPRVSHAKVYIQGQYWGTYALIEQIDKRYLKRNFATDNGNLWKNKGNNDLSWQGTDINNYPFELQTNEEENNWSKFIEFVNVINNSSDADFKNDLENVFHVDEYLRILAIDLLINNSDSYLERGRNWYLYHEPKSNKIHWLPWDYNLTFNRGEDGDNDFDILNSENEKILIDRVLAVPEWKGKYLNYMCEILQINMIRERLDPELDALLDLIDDDWGSTNNFFTVTDIDNAINGNTWTDNTFQEKTYQGLKKFITDRAEVVQTNITAQNHTCNPIIQSINVKDVVINEFMTSNDDGSQWVDQDNENEDWIELYNNTNFDINLTNYFLSNDNSFLHKWEFPENTIIQANSYLIIWPDKDVHQVGLHPQFKLDKDEGKLFLTHLDGSLIDAVEWDTEIAKNTSMSRFPNGTGDFQNIAVTFNAENSTLLSIKDSFTKLPFKIFPNPAKIN
ncbi:hypothetical protein FBALC1_00105 [Flavobacteriales bacterium ALC-1]|nr:hypothetical protein FBALC1_00105 [Flavobacteriales bacterium ALC-1]